MTEYDHCGECENFSGKCSWVMHPTSDGACIEIRPDGAHARVANSKDPACPRFKRKEAYHATQD